jgi:hypothetical protein
MDKRPRCADKAPDINQSKELLKKLLAIELDRLDTAVKIEKERKIVFPETTIIIHDIEKLNEAINDEHQTTSKRKKFSNQELIDLHNKS